MAIKAAGSVVLEEATAFLVATRCRRAGATFFTVARCLPVFFVGFFATFFAVFFPAGRDWRVFDAFLATDFLETDFFRAAMTPPDNRRTLAPLPVLTTAKPHVAAGKPATLAKREAIDALPGGFRRFRRFPPDQGLTRKARFYWDFRGFRHSRHSRRASSLGLPPRWAGRAARSRAIGRRPA